MLCVGKAIIFLTDGKPGWASPDRILRLIADQNAQLGNEVMILTYAVGKGKHAKPLFCATVASVLCKRNIILIYITIHADYVLISLSRNVSDARVTA